MENIDSSLISFSEAVRSIRKEPFEKADLLLKEWKLTPLIDLGIKREEFRKKRLIQQQALEEIGKLKELIAVYEVEMNQLAQDLSQEQLAHIAPLTPQEKIQEDLHRLNTLVEALEVIVKEKKGLSLPETFHILKAGCEGEMGEVIDYIKKSTYPVFAKMRKFLNSSAIQ